MGSDDVGLLARARHVVGVVVVLCGVAASGLWVVWVLYKARDFCCGIAWKEYETLLQHLNKSTKMAPYFGMTGGWLTFWVTVACATDV